MPALLQYCSAGIYCPRADVYVDPILPVDKAIISHAHTDCARIGHRKYLTHKVSSPFLKLKLGSYANVQEIEYAETISINGVNISLHPAGHVPGSSQVRFEYKGEVWVVSGDYKLSQDGIAQPLVALQCHTFVSEARYGLPFFRWRPQQYVHANISKWWKNNAEQGIHSVLVAYPFGKAQRILKNLQTDTGHIFVDEQINTINSIYRSLGIDLPKTYSFDQLTKSSPELRGLSVVSPSTLGSDYGLHKLQPYSLGMVSGKMKIDSIRRKKAIDTGFVLSDHADWIGLNTVIRASCAERILINQGQSVFFSKFL